MKEEVILKVENVSKQYRLGLIGTGTISHDLNRFFVIFITKNIKITHFHTNKFF